MKNFLSDFSVRCADKIDSRLNRALYQTVIHGDAKVENFCFATGGRDVAALDFQWSGGGVGVKDVYYLPGIGNGKFYY